MKLKKYNQNYFANLLKETLLRSVEFSGQIKR